MLQQVMHADGSPEQGRLLWLAAAARLTAPAAAGHFLRVAELSDEERVGLLDRFIELAQARLAEQLQLRLDAEWSTIREMARAAHFVPRGDPVEIVAFGPAEPVKCGVAFNPQPDGGSGLWVRFNRYPPPGSLVSLNGHALPTVVQGEMVTASVPAALTAEAGLLRVLLIGPGGEPRSRPVCLTVHE
jgi:hypothetical protein